MSVVASSDDSYEIRYVEVWKPNISIKNKIPLYINTLNCTAGILLHIL